MTNSQWEKAIRLHGMGASWREIEDRCNVTRRRLVTWLVDHADPRIVDIDKRLEKFIINSPKSPMRCGYRGCQRVVVSHYKQNTVRCFLHNKSAYN